MNIVCPRCETHYAVDKDALLAVDGVVHCLRCGLTFDAIAGEQVDAAARPTTPLRLDASHEQPTEVPEGPALPFEVPDDLPPLQPSEDALDIADSLREPSAARRIGLILVVVPLIALMAAQVAWQYRSELLERFPALEVVCDHLPCRPTLIHAPDRFRVLQRDIKPTANERGSLTLTARIRNTAEIAQALPDIQLSLLDNNGEVLVRRRLSPRDYTYPPPPDERVVAPGEVFTIDVDFRDPGSIATGFTLDFF